MLNGNKYVVFILYYVVFGQTTTAPSVRLNEGFIKGLRADDGDYSMFLGIPYAKVDMNNPFGPSIPYEIHDVFEAYDDSVICPQVTLENNSIISLDCLRLNVYVPTSANSSNKLLPVMLWIHGGSFHIGSGNRGQHNPSFFVKHDVIIVTINYRVGPYGFMCLDLPEVSGNQGLKDQYLAIQWTKENIKAFGGDSDQITVFGLSAGAHSIDFHMRSTKKLLFNKVILQSGSAEALTVLYSPDKRAPCKIAKYIADFETEDVAEAISFLSKIDANLVVTAADTLDMKFKPCVETLFDNVEPFIASTWINAKIPVVKNISIIMGFTKLERAALYSEDDESFDWNHINDSLSQVFNFDQTVNETRRLVSHYYLGNNKISSNLKWGVIRFASDFTYIHPIHRTVMKYLENEAKQIYLYMFSYVGGRNSVKTTSYDEFDSSGNLCCAAHGDDIAYLFNIQNKPPPSDADKIIITRLTTMWTNFAKYGDPTPAVSDLLPVVWKPFTRNDYNYLNIDSQFVLGKQPLHDRMAFWDLFYIHNKMSHKVF